ncbi:TPA: sortase [Candidatus Dojkabacteria bacterium]|uniref:Sortase n=1 Tax=Candidatus Dojkabacteria bacterium TaxID=2099670 RepID=A0A832QD33_9BACT|nr:sortase [Candidatus Dojkabacteria bacterium]
MKKTIKTLITLFLILLVLIPIGIFLIYPNYNKIQLSVKDFDFYNLTKQTTVKLLTTISPPVDTFRQEVYAEGSIEESVRTKDIILDTKILEELDATLFIDSISIEGKIYQGESSKTIDVGFWHFPLSKFPGQKGNAVIIGHRFQYLPPAKNTFFNLDKIAIGDEIVIKHKEGDWKYVVTETKVVDDNDLSVVRDSDDYRLTLITCTPLWTSEQRFVVIAKLDKLYQKV